MRPSRRFFPLVAFSILVALAAPAADGSAVPSAIGSDSVLSVSTLPLLGSLGPDDPIYLQQQEQLAASYAALKAGGAQPDLVFYLYVARSSFDLFSLAARLNLPYDAIATLNRLDRARNIVPGERLLVPSAPGLFVSDRPSSDLEYLLTYRDEAQGEVIRLSGIAGGASLRFYRGERFNSEERALFLGFLFRFPLPHGIISSGFGVRVNPVTGHTAMHHGIDLAAPMGTEVYAARDGRVSASGVDPILGQYVIIEHEGGWQTVYGHLSLRLVRLNDRVESGMIIGHVGSTGQSTGPHLHFEVRNHGDAKNPESLIPKGNK
jgi:murein DD-endopeptidase MepM/ murein hydrolase activator NlpD